MGSFFLFASARARARAREFLSIGSFNKFSCKRLCKLTVDIFPLVCYNSYSEREVWTMFVVFWKYIGDEEMHASAMTSRQLWNLRLDPCVEVVKVEG